MYPKYSAPSPWTAALICRRSLARSMMPASVGCRSASNSRNRSAAAAGVLLMLAFMTKQTALVIAPAFVVGIACLSVRRAAWFAGAFTLTLVPSFFVLDWLHDGTGPVDRVLEHNRLDVLSLVTLLGALGRG